MSTHEDTTAQLDLTEQPEPEPLVERRTVTIPRSWAMSVLLGFFFGVGALVMVGLSMLRQGEDVKRQGEDVAGLVQAQRRADLRAEQDAKEATVAARARVSEALGEVRRILEESIVAHDAQAQADHDAQMARLAELIGRPAPSTAPRPAPRTPATVAPRASGSPAAPPTTAVPKPPPVRANPPTTTTTCSTRGKSEKCR